MDAQMTTHGHPDRAYGNIVRPTERPAGSPGENLFLQVCPDRIHVRYVEDQPPPVSHRMPVFQIEDGTISLFRAE